MGFLESDFVRKNEEGFRLLTTGDLFSDTYLSYVALKIRDETLKNGIGKIRTGSRVAGIGAVGYGRVALWAMASLQLAVWDPRALVHAGSPLDGEVAT